MIIRNARFHVALKKNYKHMKKLLLSLFVFTLGFAAQAQVKNIGIQTSAVCEMFKDRLEKDLTFEKVRSMTMI